jgi:hypothetical protein
LDAPARLDVYAQGYFTRLHEVLGDDYPTVAWLCGEAAFNDLVTAYLVAHPSTSPTLRDLGRAFAAFLAEHPVTAFARERWPIAADVARLEWAFADVFDAEDARPLERIDLESRPPDRWAEIPLEPVPAFELLSLEPRASDAVSARRRGDAPPPAQASPARDPVAGSAPGPRTGWIVVWRDQERAVFRPVAGLEAEALGRVVRGDTFGDLCEWLSARTSDEGEAAAMAAGWLAAWIDAGWLLSLPATSRLG